MIQDKIDVQRGDISSHQLKKRNFCLQGMDFSSIIKIDSSGNEIKMFER